MTVALAILATLVSCQGRDPFGIVRVNTRDVAADTPRVIAELRSLGYIDERLDRIRPEPHCPRDICGTAVWLAYRSPPTRQHVTVISLTKPSGVGVMLVDEASYDRYAFTTAGEEQFEIVVTRLRSVFGSDRVVADSER